MPERTITVRLSLDPVQQAALARITRAAQELTAAIDALSEPAPRWAVDPDDSRRIIHADSLPDWDAALDQVLHDHGIPTPPTSDATAAPETSPAPDAGTGMGQGWSDRAQPLTEQCEHPAVIASPRLPTAITYAQRMAAMDALGIDPNRVTSVTVGPHDVMVTVYDPGLGYRKATVVIPGTDEGVTEPQNSTQPDPLDKTDHRTRLDRHQSRWSRCANGKWHFGKWHFLAASVCPGDRHCWGRSLPELNDVWGPLTFAPDADDDEEDQ